MLVELRIQNLLLIEDATLDFGSGLNAVTGETGAGKTMLADAIGLLLGGKPRTGVVRPGASEAYVEGVFELDETLRSDRELTDLLELLPEDAEELVLARRVSREGRTRAYLNGRSASAADLKALGSRLILFSGQLEHRKLVSRSAQLGMLDSFCGAEHLQRLSAHREVYARQRGLTGEQAKLRELAERRDLELELLEHELVEIDRADPSVELEEELEGERARLRHAEALRVAALAGAEALRPEEDHGPGLADRMAEAAGAFAAAAGVDRALDDLGERFRAVRIEAEELARDLRAYESEVDGDPGRLAEVEDRLELLSDLKRKHGGRVESVLEFAGQARSDRDRLARAGGELERVQGELESVAADVERLAAELSATRRAAAQTLGTAVERELKQLGLERARFVVSVESGEETVSRGSGADSVEFVVAPNPGVPAAPVREIASGGEMSRVLLAILSVAQAGGGAGTVLFDEIDAGIGGTTARAVGEKLRELGREGGGNQQAICITHLPQIASLADRHFRLVKEVPQARAAGVTIARVEQIESGEVVAELCRMLGADLSDAGARRHAEELLRAA